MTRVVILVCFLLTGATALAYQVLWLRLLTLVFGATVLSAGSVLAAYMAGLACGNGFWASRADRAARPLRLYAWLELGVALTALVSPLIFDLVKVVYRQLFVGGVSDFGWLSLVRLLLCLPAVIGPTFLMGGTLPVLVRYYTRSLASIGRGSGDLYAVNTLGATLGTLGTGFVAIPALGLTGTLLAAVGLNLAVALIAFGLSARCELPAAAVPPRGEELADLPDRGRRAVQVVWVGYALSGFAAMLFEVAWTRALIQVFGNSTYAFTTMLASFLIGLALGAALAGRWIDRAPDPFVALAWIQAVVGCWAAACTPLIEWLPPLFLRTFADSGGDFAAIQMLQFATCCLLLLPTTVGLGAVFPTVSRISSRYAGGVGRSVGIPLVYNTTGTVAGALLAGFVLLPKAGLEQTIAAGAALNILVAVAVLLVGRAGAERRRLAVALALVGLLLCARVVIIRLDPRILSAGVYMYPEYFLSLQAQRVAPREAMQHNRVIHYREGYGASIAVLDLGGGNRSLQTNGKTDASTLDLASQRAVAHLPLLLQPDAREVLVVGLASGCTAGSSLLYPVRQVDCVEIEPAMIAAARFFDAWNHRCLDDRRLRLLLQDARNYLMMTDRRYDVLTAEPTNPWIAGVNALFTAEYYRDCAQRLRPGGVMCQWLPAYNFTVEEMRAVLATFHSVFPYVTVWAFPQLRTDFFAVGSLTPRSFNLPALDAALRGPVLADCREVGLSDAWRFTGGLVLDEAAVTRFARGGRLNTDGFPHIEFSTPRHLHQRSRAVVTVAAAYAAGAEARLPLDEGGLATALRLLGVALGPGAPRPRRAWLEPCHVTEFTAPSPVVDVAALRLELGDRVATVAPLPAGTWPPGLAARRAAAQHAGPADWLRVVRPGLAAVWWETP